MIGYNVHITDTVTGEVAVHREDGEWEELDEYQWSEGCHCCDCNRGLFFAWARGEEDPDRDCDANRYAVRCVADDGTELYAEDITPRASTTSD